MTASNEPGGAGRVAAGGAVRALVVDDERGTRALLCRWLRAEPGVETVEAANGLEALEVLTAEPIDLVICDINMPILDGIEMLASMRKHPPCAGIPVVIVSAVDAEPKIRQAAALGVWDYIVKPLDHDSALPRLRRALDRARRKAPVPGLVRGRVLIADPDPDFLEFARGALAAHFDVDTAVTAIEAVAKALNRVPDLAVVSSSLSSGARELLDSKVKEMGLDDRMRICPLVKERDDAGPANMDGLNILRTLDPETFSEQIRRRLAGGPLPSEDAFLGADRLESALSHGVQVLLGMVGGEDPSPLESPTPLSDLELFSRCRLTARARGSIELVAGCSHDFADELARALHDVDGPRTSAAERRQALDELVETLAGSLSDFCADQCHTVVPGPVRAAPGPPKLDPDALRDFRLDLSWKQTGPLTLFCRLLGKP